MSEETNIGFPEVYDISELPPMPDSEFEGQVWYVQDEDRYYYSDGNSWSGATTSTPISICYPTDEVPETVSNEFDNFQDLIDSLQNFPTTNNSDYWSDLTDALTDFTNDNSDLIDLANDIESEASDICDLDSPEYTDATLIGTTITGHSTINVEVFRPGTLNCATVTYSGLGGGPARPGGQWREDPEYQEGGDYFLPDWWLDQFIDEIISWNDGFPTPDILPDRPEEGASREDLLDWINDAYNIIDSFPPFPPIEMPINLNPIKDTINEVIEVSLTKPEDYTYPECNFKIKCHNEETGETEVYNCSDFIITSGSRKRRTSNKQTDIEKSCGAVLSTPPLSCVREPLITTLSINIEVELQTTYVAVPDWLLDLIEEVEQNPSLIDEDGCVESEICEKPQPTSCADSNTLYLHPGWENTTPYDHLLRHTNGQTTSNRPFSDTSLNSCDPDDYDECETVCFVSIPVLDSLCPESNPLIDTEMCVTSSSPETIPSPFSLEANSSVVPTTDNDDIDTMFISSDNPLITVKGNQGGGNKGDTLLTRDSSSPSVWSGSGSIKNEAIDLVVEFIDNGDPADNYYKLEVFETEVIGGTPTPNKLWSGKHFGDSPIGEYSIDLTATDNNRSVETITII
jgi:hypothetical protein